MSSPVINMARPGPSTNLTSTESNSSDRSGAIVVNRFTIVIRSDRLITCSSGGDRATCSNSAATRCLAFLLIPRSIRETLKCSCCLDSGSWLHLSARFIEISPDLAASLSDERACSKMYFTLCTFPTETCAMRATSSLELTFSATVNFDKPLSRPPACLFNSALSLK